MDNRSEKNLIGVHPDLAMVVRRAAEISPVEFVVTSGLRTDAQQRRLVAGGASRTLRSRHLTGHAVDVAAKIDGKIDWHFPRYVEIARAMKLASKELGIPIEWGGDWKNFRDGPHFQLPRSKYP